MELIAARPGHRVDHATGAAAELDRVAAGLDLELVEEREWRSGETLPPIEVGDVEAIDEHRVLGHRRAAEGDAAEAGVAADHARRQQRHRSQALVHRHPRQFFAVDVGGRLGGEDIHAIDDAVSHNLDRVEVGHAAFGTQVDGGGAAQRHIDRRSVTDRLPVAEQLQAVVTDRQLGQAIGAIAAGRHRARGTGGHVGHGDLVTRACPPRHRAGGTLRHRHRHRHRAKARAQRHVQRRFPQGPGVHPRVSPTLVLVLVVRALPESALSPSAGNICHWNRYFHWSK